MKIVLKLVLSIGVLSATAQAAVYKIDGSHSEVGFSVKHLMLSNVKGRFNKVEGSFDFNDKKKTLNKIDIKIDAASINTNEEKRDAHLKSPDFFDVSKFPTVEFTADKINAVESGKTVKVTGNLKMHGVTHPVTLDVDFHGITNDPFGNERLIFSANAKINRSEWGLKWNKNLDKGGVVVGEEVTINIDSESIKAK